MIGGGQQPQNVFNIHADSVNIVGEQNVGQTVVTETMIETFAAGGNDGGGLQHDSSHITEFEENLEDDVTDSKYVTKLSEKIVMFNRQPLCPSARVYRAKQEFLKDKWRKIAVKLIQYKEKNNREVEILIKLSHPNIVQIYDAGEYNGGGHWTYIAMELCSQNLQDYFDENKQNPVDVQNAMSFFKQLVASIAFIHGKNITHRDLKPGNVLISMCKSSIKLSDFGLSKEIPYGRFAASVSTAVAGSEGYRAPEMYKDDPETSPRSDIFSLGIVTHSIFTNGKHPFGADQYDWSYNIRNNNRDLSKITEFTTLNGHKRKQLLDVINRMLQHNPLDRPTATQLQDHAFFKDDETKYDELCQETQAAPSHKEQPSHDPSGMEVSVPLMEYDTATLYPKTKQESANAIAVFDQSTRHLHRVDLRDNCVAKMQEYNVEMKECSSFTAISNEDHIFVLLRNRSMYKLKYRDEKSTWERLADVEHATEQNSRAVASTTSIFLLGSRPSSGKSTGIPVLHYNIASNRWNKLTDKPLDTFGSALLTSGEFFCSFGGKIHRSRSYTNKVESLNLSSMEWAELPDMKQNRCFASAAECNGKYFVVGGRYKGVGLLNSVEVFSRETNQWADMKPMIKFPENVQSHVVDGNLFVSSAGSSEIQKFDFEKGEWEMVIIQLSEVRECVAITV